MPNTKAEIKQAIEAAYDHVHTSEEGLIRQAASEFAVSNMGQEHEDWLSWASLRPETLFESAFSTFYQGSESDEIGDAIVDERKSWVKLLQKPLKALKKAGTPLTVRALRTAWETPPKKK